MPAKTYWKNCSVCQYMKKHKDFKYRVQNSRYYNELATESLPDVLRAFRDPFTQANLYAHLKRHASRDLVRAPSRIDENGNLLIDNRVKATVSIVEHIDPQSKTNHELGLDDFIKVGRDKLASGELTITSQSFLQAIKIKADIEKGTKDRRADMLKGLFSGAAPKQKDV